MCAPVAHECIDGKIVVCLHQKNAEKEEKEEKPQEHRNLHGCSGGAACTSWAMPSANLDRNTSLQLRL
jgi:hypothetical protein